MTEDAQLAQSGNYEGAVSQMLEASEKLPGNTNTAFNAALALLKHIDHRGWNEHYARSVKKFIGRVSAADPGNERLAALESYFHALLKKHAVKPDQIRPA